MKIQRKSSLLYFPFQVRKQFTFVLPKGMVLASQVERKYNFQVRHVLLYQQPWKIRYRIQYNKLYRDHLSLLFHEHATSYSK
jgi:hypothetical protein